MAIGMTYEQYWYGDPLMVRDFYKAEQLRQQRRNEEAWLNGVYIMHALNATVCNMFRKEQEKYPDKPFELAKQEDNIDKQNREEQEALFAQAYMSQMVQAGKNWGKK